MAKAKKLYALTRNWRTSLEVMPVQAHTKGEARAMFKKALGVKPKDRLPDTYSLVDVSPKESE